MKRTNNGGNVSDIFLDVTIVFDCVDHNLGFAGSGVQLTFVFQVICVTGDGRIRDRYWRNR